MNKIPRIENMIGYKGNPVRNQFKIYTDNGCAFQSYDTIIAFQDKNGQITLDPDWDYSPTTGKYRNIFLNENKQATEKKIKSGVYKIANLNG